MTFLVFSKLFTFTQIIQKHSNRSRKRNHQIEKLLVLHSHRYSFCFQGYIRMWWVGTVFAVHQPLHVHFRKAICAGPCGFCTMGEALTDPVLVQSLLLCSLSPMQGADQAHTQSKSSTVVMVLTAHELGILLSLLELTKGRLASLRMNTDSSQGRMQLFFFPSRKFQLLVFLIFPSESIAAILAMWMKHLKEASELCEQLPSCHKSRRTACSCGCFDWTLHAPTNHRRQHYIQAYGHNGFQETLFHFSFHLTGLS